MKAVVKILIFICLPGIVSCGFFRTLGLYNVPPEYSETFQEIRGEKFIEHSNKKEPIVITLESKGKEYSPYDEVVLILKVYNTGSDTIYMYEPGLSAHTFPYRELIIRNSLSKNIRVLEYTAHIDYLVLVDDYGRRINPTIAPDGFKLSPGDSLIKNLIFRTGERIIEDAPGIFSFSRENLPGIYSAFYIQAHEEYDEIKGPIPTTLVSPDVLYTVLDYSDKEIEIRNEVKRIISDINYNADSLRAASLKVDSLKIDSLFTELKKNFPDNIYIPQIQRYLEMVFFLINNSKHNKLQNTR